ncbi:hypothetical protein SAV31267_036660 [Streptomyces avermitilis]|uniref:Uncharacterized protein n=1 Tax=Streptomyces avermitilis TaxID=33903 RepID=A0A4D4MPY9_STRAX|nr:hypothetical protein SAVMC3_62270 [Streptomyces avermitilis]GDY74181.1 hypothetical protein SAV31267_036660 [Streptomyces avermitilis]
MGTVVREARASAAPDDEVRADRDRGHDRHGTDDEAGLLLAAARSRRLRDAVGRLLAVRRLLAVAGLLAVRGLLRRGTLRSLLGVAVAGLLGRLLRVTVAGLGACGGWP